jgi:hypothetical protein
MIKDPRNDPEYRQGRVADLQARIEQASEKAALMEPLEIEPQSKEESQELAQLAEEYRKNWAQGHNTVSVTIRMRPETVDALRYEARRLGVRGYQTLLKQWIDDRLHDRDMVSYAEVRRALGPILRLSESGSEDHILNVDEILRDLEVNT